MNLTMYDLRFPRLGDLPTRTLRVQQALYEPGRVSVSVLPVLDDNDFDGFEDLEPDLDLDTEEE